MPKKYTRLEQAWGILGEVFGRLTVLEHVGKDKDGHNIYDALCSCDEPKMVRCVKGAYLRAGRVKSCGCLKKEAAALARKFKASLRQQQIALT